LRLLPKLNDSIIRHSTQELQQSRKQTKSMVQQFDRLSYLKYN